MTKIKERLIRSLRIGLLITFLAGLILFVISNIISWVDNLWQPLWIMIFERKIPGLGFLVTLFLALIIGLILSSEKISSFLFKESVLDKIFRNIPVVRWGWREGKIIKKNIDQFQKEASIVHVEWPRKGHWKIGFMSGYQKAKSGKEFYRVFIPNGPLPHSGFADFVEAELASEQIKKLNISFNEALKIIASGGFLSPEELEYLE